MKEKNLKASPKCYDIMDEDLSFCNDEQVHIMIEGTIISGRIVGISSLNPKCWIIDIGYKYSEVYPYTSISIPQYSIIKEK